MKTIRKPGPLYRLIVLLMLSGVILGACQPTEVIDAVSALQPVTFAFPAIGLSQADVRTLAEVALFDAPQPTQASNKQVMSVYIAQAGDSVGGLVKRFSVSPLEIVWHDAPENAALRDLFPGFIDPGLILSIPRVFEDASPAARLLPDSEVIFSASAADFDVDAYLIECNGFLASYRASEFANVPMSSAQVIERVALENSINPRLLLAILEYYNGCVRGELAADGLSDYLMGVNDWQHKGLYRQLIWLVEQLTIGYYGWRDGSLTEIVFKDGSGLRLNPTLNAGTVALQYTFAQLYDRQAWELALDPQNGFAALYAEMFGNPWRRAQAVEPLFPSGFSQPPMDLPFLPGHTWAYTGGPHSAWEKNGALAALDFAPSSLEASCEPSYEWVVAVASGKIVRVGEGMIVQDLDGDGSEHTGWVVVYLHVHHDQPELFRVGTWIEAGDLIGHPSCEGGPSQSTHLHIARKYNGEWMLAGGPEPFNLNGWKAIAGVEPYDGYLIKDGIIIEANDMALRSSYVKRPRAGEK